MRGWRREMIFNVDARGLTWTKIDLFGFDPKRVGLLGTSRQNSANKSKSAVGSRECNPSASSLQFECKFQSKCKSTATEVQLSHISTAGVGTQGVSARTPRLTVQSVSLVIRLVLTSEGSKPIYTLMRVSGSLLNLIERESKEPHFFRK